MSKPLTTRSINAWKPTDKRQEVSDAALRALKLVVQPSGVKSWAVRYRYNGKREKLTLGRWPAMGLADARAAASEALEEVALGRNPAANKKQAKAARMEGRDQFATLLVQYDQRHLSTLKRGHDVKRLLEIYAAPRWGDTDVQRITRRDVRDLLDEIVADGKGTTANRFKSALHHFFGWLLERDIVEANPVVGLSRPAKEQARERVLTEEEVQAYWEAASSMKRPWGPFAQMLILTGQRTREVAGMTTEEVDGDTWTLPGSRTKNGKAHAVPLSDAAQDVLDACPPAGGLYHTTNGATPVSGYTKGRAAIHRRMEEILGREVPHWTWHDIRRTVATGMARIGVSVAVTEAVLNHTSGTTGGLVAVYQRYDYAEEKRRALEAWAAQVTDIRTENVVSLRQ